MNKTPQSPFERIRRDRTNGGYSTRLMHRDRKIEFRILAESQAELRELLPAAEKFWRTRARWFKSFRDYAATELLSALHDNLDWGQDNPPVFTAGQIRKLLDAPFSVVIGSDDDGDVYFEMSGGEGKALQEHCFEVSGTFADGITDGDVVALF
jgi:hypothetical protein